jgi:hypothetical protein
MLARCALVALAIAALAGCASVPEAPRERDTEAKQFTAQPGTSTFYVYRDDPVLDMNTQESVLYVDETLIGATLPKTYFRFDVQPGEHALHGIAHDQGSLRIATRPGEIYFIKLDVLNGNSRFTQVSPEAAKRDIARCCTLLEKWSPGQRPLLR